MTHKTTFNLIWNQFPFKSNHFFTFAARPSSQTRARARLCNRKSPWGSRASQNTLPSSSGAPVRAHTHADGAAQSAADQFEPARAASRRPSQAPPPPASAARPAIGCGLGSARSWLVQSLREPSPPHPTAMWHEKEEPSSELNSLPKCHARTSADNATHKKRRLKKVFKKNKWRHWKHNLAS